MATQLVPSAPASTATVDARTVGRVDLDDDPARHRVRARAEHRDGIERREPQVVVDEVDAHAPAVDDDVPERIVDRAGSYAATVPIEVDAEDVAPQRRSTSPATRACMSMIDELRDR